MVSFPATTWIPVGSSDTFPPMLRLQGSPPQATVQNPAKPFPSQVRIQCDTIVHLSLRIATVQSPRACPVLTPASVDDRIDPQLLSIRLAAQDHFGGGS